MPKSRIILCLGFFIALLPVLGFPNSWDHFFDTASGLLIVLLSVLISVDKRLMLKAKAEKRTMRKRALAPAPVAREEVPEVQLEPMVEVPMMEVHEEPAYTMPTYEPVVEAPREPEHRSRRPKKKINVLDGDAAAPAPAPIDETNMPNF